MAPHQYSQFIRWNRTPAASVHDTSVTRSSCDCFPTLYLLHQIRRGRTSARELPTFTNVYSDIGTFPAALQVAHWLKPAPGNKWGDGSEPHVRQTSAFMTNITDWVCVYADGLQLGSNWPTSSSLFARFTGRLRGYRPAKRQLGLGLLWETTE